MARMKMTEKEYEEFRKKNPKAEKQYDKPIGPSRPPKKSVVETVRGVAQKVEGGARKVYNSEFVGKVKNRAHEIAEESERPEPRRRGKPARLPSNLGITDPGIGPLGHMNRNPFDLGNPWGGGPSRAPRRASAPRGRVLYDEYGNEVIIKPKKRRARRAPAEPRNSGLDMMHIPAHMKWMF